MKNILLFLITLAIIGIGCTLSPEKKAQKAIKEYVKKNLDDPKSYESIEFSELLNDSTDFKDIPLGKKLSDSLSHTKFDYELDSLGIIDCLNSDYPKGVLEMNERSIKVTRKKYFDTQRAYTEEIKNFKSEFKGYIMDHTFRAKNGFGGYVKESHWFYLDKDFRVYDFL